MIDSIFFKELDEPCQALPIHSWESHYFDLEEETEIGLEDLPNLFDFHMEEGLLNSPALKYAAQR